MSDRWDAPQDEPVQEEVEPTPAWSSDDPSMVTLWTGIKVPVSPRITGRISDNIVYSYDSVMHFYDQPPPEPPPEEADAAA